MVTTSLQGRRAAGAESLRSSRSRLGIPDSRDVKAFEFRGLLHPELYNDGLNKTHICNTLKVWFTNLASNFMPYIL